MDLGPEEVKRILKEVIVPFYILFLEFQGFVITLI